MKLYLFAFGKLRTDGVRSTADYFQRLIRPWASLEEVELKPISVPDKSPATRKQIQTKEGQRLLEKISKTAGDSGWVFLLDEAGKSKSTLAWAEEIQRWESSGIKSVSLCIGSSLGFSPEVRQKAQGSFSFGPQTLSHELARIILLEQLYRALSVNRGHPYHNEGTG